MPEFSQRLLLEITRVRSTLKTSWLVASGFILTQHLKYYKEALHFNLFGTNASSPAGRTKAELDREEKELQEAEEVSLRSANVLMSRQLREIVEASVEDLVEFFQHKQETGQAALVIRVAVSDTPEGTEGQGVSFQCHDASWLLTLALTLTKTFNPSSTTHALSAYFSDQKLSDSALISPG